MAEPSDPRDLLYGGRDDPREIGPQPVDQSATKPAEPDLPALKRAFAFVNLLNVNPSADPVDYQRAADQLHIYNLADEHALVMKAEQLGRLLLLDRASGAEIGTALWWNPTPDAGYWVLYVNVSGS